MSKKTWLFLLPFIIFLMGAVFLFKGLYSDPTKLESVMVDKNPRTSSFNCGPASSSTSCA